MLQHIVVAVEEIASHHKTITLPLVTVLRPHGQLVDLHRQTVQIYIAGLHIRIGRVVEIIPHLIQQGALLFMALNQRIDQHQPFGGIVHICGVVKPQFHGFGVILFRLLHHF
ncbi:hypothetical protein D3C81_1359300 [compost metagenome]